MPFSKMILTKIIINYYIKYFQVLSILHYFSNQQYYQLEKLWNNFFLIIYFKSNNNFSIISIIMQKF